MSGIGECRIEQAIMPDGGLARGFSALEFENRARQAIGLVELREIEDAAPFRRERRREGRTSAGRTAASLSLKLSGL